MSGHLQSLLEANDLDWTTVLNGHDGYGLVSFTVKELKDLNQAIEPILEDKDDPAHIHVAGKKTGSIKKKLAAIGSNNVVQMPRQPE